MPDLTRVADRPGPFPLVSYQSSSMRRVSWVTVHGPKNVPVPTIKMTLSGEAPRTERVMLSIQRPILVGWCFGHAGKKTRRDDAAMMRLIRQNSQNQLSFGYT
jgi:hypothetical protein